MMYEKRFLADGISSVDDPFYGYIVDVVEPGEDEKNSREVISPQFFIDVGVDESADAADDEGENEQDVAVDPDVVGEVVMVYPVDGWHLHDQLLILQIY